MKKKVSNDIRELVEHCVSTHERGLFVIVGDKARFQVANLHYLLQRILNKKPTVLWCYKKSLEVSSHQRKRQKMAKKLAQKGLYDENVENPYELFLRTTDITYCYYKESQRILGQTFGLCVLQDFEALTPNVLCRTIETVEGGGLICILLRTMESLQDLYNITMDIHGKLCSFGYDKAEPRFVRRFVLSLSDGNNMMVVDDELNILPICKGGLSINKKKDSRRKLIKLLNKLGTDEYINNDYDILKKLSSLAITYSQLKALIKLQTLLIDIDNIKHVNIVTIFSDRGRGKSATIGIFLSAALNLDYRNIIIIAPNIENVITLFKFIEIGLNKLGIYEHVGYNKIKYESYTSIINIINKRNCYVKFISSNDINIEFIKNQFWDILIIEEAASISLPKLEMLCNRGIIIISSTIGGYEGTDIKLNEPIRYNKNDSIELWLNKLLCLNYIETNEFNNKLLYITNNIIPSKCKFFLINRDILFSYNNYTELILNKIIYILTSSHYRNTPDDLLLLSDAPSHKLLILAIIPNDKQSINDIIIISVLHIAFEGNINKNIAYNNIKRGIKPSGDMIPWTITQHFCTDNFSELNGIRIIRIAVQQPLQKLGYGTETINRLINNINIITNINETTSKSLLIDVESNDEELITNNKSTIDYIGTSFSITSSLVRFWTRLGFQTIYTRQVPNETTGEFSCIMILNLIKNNNWLDSFTKDYKKRLLTLASSCWRNLPAILLLSLINHHKSYTNKDNNTTDVQSNSVPLADPPEVTTSRSPAVSSSNYLSPRGKATPGDRGEGSVEVSDGSSIMGMMEDGAKDVLDVTSSGMKCSTGPRVEPVADLREAKGEVKREGTTPSGKGGVSTRPRVEPAADLREAKGEVKREGSLQEEDKIVTSGGGDWKYKEKTLTINTSGSYTSTDDKELSIQYMKFVLTEYDLSRINRYMKQMADFTIVTDLIPTLSYIYFMDYLKLTLPFIQGVILFGMGIQHKSSQELCEELKMPLNQIMALLHKTISKIAKHMCNF